MSKKIAIVAGIDNYNSTRWPDLHCCLHDSTEVADALRIEEFGFEVTLLRDGEATTTSILRKLVEARNSHPELLVFYFAGHGASTELGSSIVTFDNEEYREGIDLSQIASIMTSASGNSVTLLDCCHAGGARYRGNTSVEALRAEAVRKIYSGFDSSKAIIAACGEAEYAVEDETRGHGLFTYYLLEGLLGEAADYKGNISVHSLYDYVSRPFFERASTQNPVFRGDVTGRLILASGFSPRLGPPLEENVSLALEGEAESLLEGYSRRQAEYPYAEWRTKGYDAACRALTPIDAWFKRQLAKTPSLIRRKRFSELYESLLSRKIQLGAIDPGTMVRDGIIERSIGSGGFGTVWKIRTNDNSPDKAYKVYHPHDIRDLEKTSRFRNGFEAMDRLHHNHIVKVHRFTDCPLGFVMDYIPGENLREIDPVNTIRDTESQLSLLIEIADTVRHAHDNDVIHRDVKPENIICIQDEQAGWTPFLTDFDLAWFTTQTRRATKSALGVVYYAAPEQHVAFDPKKAVGKRPTLDVFSFGQLCHFILTGIDPDPVRLDVNAERISAKLSGWSTSAAVAQFRELYEGCTRWEPEERIGDFDTILATLRDIRDEITYTSLDRKVDVSDFVAELFFQLSGQPLDPSQQHDVAFTSSSGNWNIQLNHRERPISRKAKTGAIIEAHFTPNMLIGLERIKNERMRTVRNSRVDSVLGSDGSARRRSGRQGSYEVYVDFTVVSLNIRSVRTIRDKISRVIGALERS